MATLWMRASQAMTGLAMALLVLAALAAPVREAGAVTISQCPSAADANGKCAGCVSAGTQCTIGGNAGTCSVLASQCCDCVKAGPATEVGAE